MRSVRLVAPSGSSAEIAAFTVAEDTSGNSGDDPEGAFRASAASSRIAAAVSSPCIGDLLIDLFSKGWVIVRR